VNLPTLFLRLEGPLQSWGITSQWTVRDTAQEPTKSGVLGLICCALGLRRDSDKLPGWLERLNRLRFGARVDHPGRVLYDYHTVGAKIGNLAANGTLKITESSGELETVLSHRYYLCDASFLAALQGDRETLKQVQDKLNDPCWPLSLGRKSCPPSVPMLEDTPQQLKEFDGLESALKFIPWRPRMHGSDPAPNNSRVRAVLEADPGSPGAQPRQDAPERFYPPRHGTRWTVETTLEVSCENALIKPYKYERPLADYRSEQWKAKRKEQMKLDEYRCVFCGEKAVRFEIHHKTYVRAGGDELAGKDGDLCTLCKPCHEAVTQLEYEYGMDSVRVDPQNTQQWAKHILAKRQTIVRDRQARHPRGKQRA
jgi:CRISPR system Cascade subunit CasD